MMFAKQRREGGVGEAYEKQSNSKLQSLKFGLMEGLTLKNTLLLIIQNFRNEF